MRAEEFVELACGKSGVKCVTCTEPAVVDALRKVLDLSIERGKAKWSWRQLSRWLQQEHGYSCTSVSAMLNHIQNCEPERYERIQALRGAGVPR